MAKATIENKSSVGITETKPGLGTFHIESGKSLTIEDVKDKDGKILYTGEVIARSIVEDRANVSPLGKNDLVLVGEKKGSKEK